MPESRCLINFGQIDFIIQLIMISYYMINDMIINIHKIELLDYK
jgi:hypothetical protein